MAPRTNLVPNSPRQGIGGVTLQNVANVGRFGSQAMPQNQMASTTQNRPTRFFNPPGTSPKISDEDLEAFLFGDVSPTAGARYAGFPTQSAWESAITGRAYDILGQANLARQLAQQEEDRILGELSADAARREAKYQSDIDRALAPLAPPSVKDLFTGGFRGQLEQMPTTIPTVQENLGRAMATRDIVGATVDEREADRALRQLSTNVDPSLNLSQQILAYTPAELAQEIAVRQYGMNPQLAAGTFGPDWESQYYNDLVALDTAQRDYERMQQGFYPETMEETIFRVGGVEALNQYREDAASKAMGTDPVSIAEEEERQQSGLNDEVDDVLADQYFGITPGQITSKVDEPIIRSVMNDPRFKAAFDEMAQAFQPGGSQFSQYDTQEMRRMKINEKAFDIYGATVQATVLADLIASWSLTGP